MLELVLEADPGAGGGDDGRSVKIDVELWGSLAQEMAPLLEKGSVLLVEGRLASREFEDRNRIMRHRMALRASRVEIVS